MKCLKTVINKGKAVITRLKTVINKGKAVITRSKAVINTGTPAINPVTSTTRICYTFIKDGKFT